MQLAFHFSGLQFGDADARDVRARLGKMFRLNVDPDTTYRKRHEYEKFAHLYV
jgi:hypothetical protein